MIAILLSIQLNFMLFYNNKTRHIDLPIQCKSFKHVKLHCRIQTFYTLEVEGNENEGGLGGWLLFETVSDRGDRCLFTF